MKNFIKGAIFVSLIIPCIECLASIIEQGTQFLCTKMAVKTYELKAKLNEDEVCINTHAIGFHMPDRQEDDEEGE